MITVSLMDVQRPMLIVKAKTGVIYFNQVGGCGCFHKEQEGYLIPLLGIDPMEHRTFNCHVWYSEGFGHEAPDLTKDGPILPIGMKAIEDVDYHRRDWEFNRFVWWEDVVETIESLDNRASRADNFIRMKVKKDAPELYEAWIEVRALIFTKERSYSRGEGVTRSAAKEWVDAVLTWQNCD